MSATTTTRRALLRSLGAVALAVPLLQACGGTSPTTGAAPTAPAAGASTAPTTVAAKPTTAAQPKSQAAPAGATIPLRIAVRTEQNNEWQTHWAKEWGKQNPNVALKIESLPYADMAKKQLAELATNTMQDVVYSGIKWFPYSAAKGAFRSLDDLVKSNDPGMDDFIDAAVAGCKFEGKLFALPSELQTGNHTQIVFNKDMLAAKGVDPPTDDWNVDDFVKTVTKLTDKDKKIYGTDYFPGTYYDLDALARTWGGEILSKDAKKFTLATDPKTVAAAQWAYDLRTKGLTPAHAEVGTDVQQLFPAGKVAMSTVGVYAFLSLGKTVGDKFKWDGVLFPKGMDGFRGYEGFVVMWSVYSKSAQPDTAFDLVAMETSKEVGVWSVLNDGYQPSARKSVWSDPQVTKINTIFQRTLDWMTNQKDQGPFPMPDNLRFSELEDKFENTSQSLFYGEVPFEQGLQKVQQECEKIIELPRP